MIDVRVKVTANSRRVLERLDRQGVRNLQHAAAALRKIVRNLIRYRKDPQKTSPPGTPPYTHGDRRLRRAILFAVERGRGRAVIGPSATIVGKAGAAHEHGGPYKDETFPRRPFMGPALELIKPHLPEFWANSIR